MMANKRQRKKQKAKQNRSLLLELGVPKKKAEKIKNKPSLVKLTINQRKKEIKKEQRQREANRRSKLIKELGLKVSEHSSKRYWSAERFAEWYEKEKKKKKRREYQRAYRARKRQIAKTTEGKVVMILWKDRTDFSIDDSTIQLVKESAKNMTVKELVENLNESRNYTSGEIGDYKIEVTDNPAQIESYYAGEYYTEYVGNGTHYKKLLSAIGGLFAGLYYTYEKEIFIFDLVTKMNEVNPKTAARLVHDFNLY